MEKDNKINNESDCEQFFGLSSDIMVIADPDGTFKKVNPACLKVLGYSEDEILSKPFIDFVYSDDKQSTLDEMARQIKTGSSLNFENRYICKDGKVLWFSWHANYNKDKGVTYAIARDITERKQMDIENLRVKRALKMLSESNQTLIHSTDEMSLLNSVCKIVTSISGYRLVWVGFAENDQNKTIRPVVFSGIESEYLDSINATWADTERGHGPTGVAIRTRKPSVSHNIETDSFMIPWREDALKRGFKSSIALPLFVKDTLFGVISIYSSEINTFNDEEIKILSEMASDLSFGINILRKNIEHERLEEELLKASGHRYKALFLSSRDAIMTLEPPEWKFTSANPATVKLFGAKDEGNFLNNEPWTVSPLLQLDGRHSDEKAKEMIEKAMKEGSNFFEWTHKRLNGEEFPAEVLLSKVEQNGNTFLHAVIRDISERKKLEEKMKETNKELEAKIAERTEELSSRIKELESFNKVMVGRELKMVELKKEIENLKK